MIRGHINEGMLDVKLLKEFPLSRVSHVALCSDLRHLLLAIEDLGGIWQTRAQRTWGSGKIFIILVLLLTTPADFAFSIELAVKKSKNQAPQDENGDAARVCLPRLTGEGDARTVN